MPRRRRRGRGKRYGYFGKFGNDAQLALKVAKRAMSLINVEKKYLDVTGAADSSATLVATLLNGIAQGDTSITRNGDSIKYINCFIRMNFTLHASGTQSRVRVILLRDIQCNGGLSATGNILASNTNILSPRNLDWNKRYKVYKDKTLVLNTDFPEKSLIFSLKKIKFHTRYTDENATIASISTNSLLWCVMTDEATNVPAYTFYSRLRFIDN